ncbi:hypothetical protein IAR55_004182 [Kwoniella newhampshirensis]|uniref:Uncharacterized protein n=1 Tax=Kwoniella newhampshirensis TaxID=1651941 RepID=A0AAW0YYC8_9TREE
MLIGLLPLLAISSASAYVIDSPPPSPSLAFSATFSATLSPSLSPSLGSVPSPHSPLISSSTIPSPLSPSLASAATVSATATADAGLGFDVPPPSKPKGLGTNAERLKRGLGPLPPTRRSSANKVRRSADPALLAARPGRGDTTTDNENNNGDGNATSTGTDGSNNGATTNNNTDGTTETPQNSNASTDDTNNGDQTGVTDGTGDNDPSSGENDGNSFNRGPTLLASKRKYTMRMRNPNDLSDMGPVTIPDGKQGNDLLSLDLSLPPLSILLPPSIPLTQPFEIVPTSSSPGDAFSGPRKVLGAIPRRRGSGSDGDGNSGDLANGSSNYANIGMAWPDATGLLHININAVAHPFLSNSNSDSANPSQLLANPTSTDTTHLLDASVVSNLPSELFGSPQSAIWTFHSRSSRLLAHFVNTDGNTVPTYFVTGGSCQHTLCLTADVAAFRDAYGQDALEVHVLATADV